MSEKVDLEDVTSFKITNRQSGKGYEVKNLVTNIKWVTDLNYSAGTLNFDLIQEDQPIMPAMGSAVSFIWQNTKVFFGYVFKMQVKEDLTVSVTAYDKMRYLKNQDSIVWQAGTIADRFKNVCSRAGISCRVVDAPSYKVPAEVCDSKTYFDMIKSAIDKTRTATGTQYYVTANYDTVELRKAPSVSSKKLVLDSRTVLDSYTYSEDIDNAANVVRIVQKNEKKSQTKTATADDNSDGDPKSTTFTIAQAQGDSVAQWGKLQIAQAKKDKANWAQMVQNAKDVLKQKNVVNKTFKIESIGDPSLVAGNGIDVYIADLKKTWTSCPILKATHSFGTDYKCELEMKVNDSWQTQDDSSTS